MARVSGRRVEHWHAAREAGEAAALGMMGLDAPARRTPWVYSEFAGELLDVVGWAPSPDEVVVRHEGQLVAYLVDGVVTQLAVVNGAELGELGLG